MTEPSDTGIITNVFGGFADYNARVAQLVEHNLAKVGAAGSSPVSRFFYLIRKVRHFFRSIGFYRCFFVAQARQAPSCLHEMVFVGRKNMEHDSAECLCEKSSRSQPTRLDTMSRMYIILLLGEMMSKSPTNAAALQK